MGTSYRTAVKSAVVGASPTAPKRFLEEIHEHSNTTAAAATGEHRHDDPEGRQGSRPRYRHHGRLNLRLWGIECVCPRRHNEDYRTPSSVIAKYDFHG